MLPNLPVIRPLLGKLQSTHVYLADPPSVKISRPTDPLHHADMVFGTVPTFVRFDTCYPSPPMDWSDKGDPQACSPRTAAGTSSHIASRRGSPRPSSVSPSSPAVSGSKEIADPTGPNRSYSTVQQTRLEPPQALPIPGSQTVPIAPSIGRPVAVTPSKPAFRPHVLVSCEPCKRAHVKCQQKRPCERCVRRGIPHDCIDVVHKERGRPPKDPEKARAKAAGKIVDEARARTRSIVEGQPVPSQPVPLASYDDHQSYNAIASSNSDRPPNPHRSMIAYTTTSTSQHIAASAAMPNPYSSQPPTSRPHGYFLASAASPYPSQHRRHPSVASNTSTYPNISPMSASRWQGRQTPGPYAYGQPSSLRNQSRPLSPTGRLDQLPPPPARYPHTTSKPAAVEPTQHADPSRNLRGIELSRSHPYSSRPQLPAHEQQSLQLPPLRMSSVIGQQIGHVLSDRAFEQRHDPSPRYSYPPSAYPHISTPQLGYHQATAYHPQPSYTQHYRPDVARTGDAAERQPEQQRYAPLQLQQQHYAQQHESSSKRGEEAFQRGPTSARQDQKRRDRERGSDVYPSGSHSTGAASGAKAKSRTFNDRGSASSSSESLESGGLSRRKPKKKKGSMEIADLVH